MNNDPIFTSSFSLGADNLYCLEYTTSSHHYPNAVIAEETLREILLVVDARLPEPPFFVRRVLIRRLPRGRFMAQIFVDSDHELSYPSDEVLSLLEPYRRPPFPR